MNPKLFDCTNIPLYTCNQCPKFQTHLLTLMETHYKTNHINFDQNPALHKCQKCHFETHSVICLLKHTRDSTNHKVTNKHKQIDIFRIKIKFPLNKHHVKQHNDHQCPFCPFQATSEQQLRKHDILEHSIGEDFMYECKYCGQKLAQRSGLRSHVKMWCKKVEREETLYTHNCKFCPFRSKYRANLHNHILVKHTDIEEIRWFKCECCEYKAKTKGLLEQHQRVKKHVFNQHTNEVKSDWFQCEYCNRMVKDKGKHVRLWCKKIPGKEVNPTYFLCEYCSYQTKHQYHLNTHILLRHTSDDKIQWFECEYCDYKTKLKHSLPMHVKTHENSNIKCDFCTFRFKEQSKLEAHILNKHTNDDKDKIEWVGCECGFKSMTSKGLSYHSKFHCTLGRINYHKCDYCSFKTKRKYLLRDHVLNRHTEEGDLDWFACEKCKFRTKTKNALRYHVNYRCKLEKETKCE